MGEPIKLQRGDEVVIVYGPNHARQLTNEGWGPAIETADLETPITDETATDDGTATDETPLTDETVVTDEVTTDDGTATVPKAKAKKATK